MQLPICLLLLASLVRSDVNEKLRLGLKPSSSDYQGLEAPLVGSAASPVQRRIALPHHHPEDENNLERLCNDPFHSFLCKAVGPRRNRIDGNLRPGAVLPAGLSPQPAASFLKERTQPLESGSALLSDSRDPEDRGYLPPSGPSARPPQQTQEPQYLPPYQATYPAAATPSHAYLPAAGHELQPIQAPQVIHQFVPLQSQVVPVIQPQLFIPSNAYLPSSGQNLQPASTIQIYHPLPQSTLPSNAYLPIEESNVLPDSSNLSPNIEGGALLSSPGESDSPASPATQKGRIALPSHRPGDENNLDRLCNDPFHSFLCKPTKPRKRIDGNLRPGARIPPHVLLGASSIRRETRVLPSESGSALLSSSQDGPSQNYIPNSDNKPSQSYNTFPSTPQNPQNPQNYYGSNINSAGSQNQGYQYPQPSNNQIFTFSSTTPRPYQYPQPSNNQQSYISPGNQFGYNYDKPQNPFTYPTTLATTTIRPVEYPRPSNIQQNIIASGQNAYSYPKPSYTFPAIPSTQATQIYQTVQTTYPSTTTTTSRPTFSYQYTNPTSIQQNVVSTGYNYQRPVNAFTLPTTQRPAPTQIFQTYQTITHKPTVGYQYQRPSNIQQNIVSPPQQGEYNYQRPSVPFPIVTTSRPVQTSSFQTTSRPTPFPTTTQRPAYQYQIPSNNPQNVASASQQSGYNYPKPVNTFPVPTTQKPRPTFPTYPTTTYRPVTLIATKPTPGYQYPSPSNTQQNFAQPSNQNGYNYPKPSNPFLLPTTQRPLYTYQTFPSTTQRPVMLQTFPTTTRRPITTTQKPFYQYPQPTNIQQNIVSASQSGYNYPMPLKPFPIPSTQRPIQTYPISIITTTTLRPTVGYQYPQPSNTQQNVVPQNGYVYQKPTGFTLPTTQRPTFHTTTTRKPIVQYPQPTNVQQNIVSQGYNYPKPSTAFLLQTTTRPSYQAFITSTSRPTTTVGYPYAESSNIQQSGYNYPKPSNVFPLPTTTYRPSAQTFLTTKQPSTTTQRPAVINQQPNPSNIYQNVVPSQSGYNYPKPSNTFTLPTTKRPQYTQTSPTPIAYPSNIQQNVISSSQTGYNYPKPTNTFPTTTYKPFSTTPRPIQSAYPSNVQQNVVSPSSQGGYNYPNPAGTYTVPTTTYRPVTSPVTTERTTESHEYPKPSNVQQSVVTAPNQNGYTYSRPANSFTYPTQRPTAAVCSSCQQGYNPQPVPSNQQPSIVSSPSSSGYEYPRPSKPLPLPSHQVPQTAQPLPSHQVPQTAQPLPSHQVPQTAQAPSGQGYSYDRPSNPFSLPQESRAFGRRLTPRIGNHLTGDNEFLPLRNFEIIKR